MKIAACPLTFLFLFSLVTAVSTQQQSLDVNATEIQSLVQIEGRLEFNPFVPFRENSANVTVRLAIPPSSFSTLTSDELLVYVFLRPKKNDSLLYFRNGSTMGRSYYLTLVCKISGSTCANGSVTGRNIAVYFNSPSEEPLKGDSLLVNASLFPIIPEQSSSGEIVVNETVYPIIEELSDRIRRVVYYFYPVASNASTDAITQYVYYNMTLPPISGGGAQLNDSLLQRAAELARQAQQRLAAGDYAGARQAINESERALNDSIRNGNQTATATTPAISNESGSATAQDSSGTTGNAGSATGVTGLFLALVQPPVPYILLVLLAFALAVALYEKRKGKGLPWDEAGKNNRSLLDFGENYE